MSLSGLMTGSDIIVVATTHRGPTKPSDLKKLRDAPETPGTVLQLEGWTGMRIRGRPLSRPKTLQIERIVASVWDEKELRKRLVSVEVEDDPVLGPIRRFRACERIKDGNRWLFLVLFNSSSAFMEANLPLGKRHLLWLAAYDMPRKEAKYLGVRPAACYQVVDRWKGAICLSDVSDLNEEFRKHTDRLLERCSETLRVDPDAVNLDAVRTLKSTRNEGVLFLQNALLKNTFGTKDPRLAVRAADAFAEAMMEGAPTERLLQNLAQKDEAAYALAATELLKEEDLRRFRFREEAQPKPEKKSNRGDQGESGPTVTNPGDSH